MKAFKIYNTNQVTNPINKWNTVQIKVDQMPYKLILEIEKSKTDRFQFIRISAVNFEFGEGAFSSIVELKKIGILFWLFLQLF